MKTTKADFETFKAAAKTWQTKLGLMDWALYFDHKLLEDEYARCYWANSDKTATIVLSTHWDKLRPKTNQEIERAALHEVLHLMFAQYCAQAEARYTTRDALESAEHSIIRQLESVLL